MPTDSKRPEEVIDLVRSCAMADPEIEILWLYGSRATDTANNASDYDFAIAFNHFPSDVVARQTRPHELAIEWASELGLDDDTISVVDINLAPIPLAGEVVSGRVLLNKNPLRLYREENRISSMIELDWQYHQEHYG